jgi:hypothetical protein
VRNEEECVCSALVVVTRSGMLVCTIKELPGLVDSGTLCTILPPSNSELANKYTNLFQKLLNSTLRVYEGTKDTKRIRKFNQKPVNQQTKPVTHVR